MSLDPRLLEILACPQDHGPLYYLESEGVLYNPRLTRSYEIRDGIPIVGVTVEPAEHERLSAVIADQHVAPTFVAGD
jgi:hypothetical protein